MEDTMRMLKVFQLALGSLHSGCVVFNEKTMQFMDLESEGGVEITLSELRALKSFADNVEYSANRFVSLCDYELQNKQMKELDRSIENA